MPYIQEIQEYCDAIIDCRSKLVKCRIINPDSEAYIDDILRFYKELFVCCEEEVKFLKSVKVL